MGSFLHQLGFHSNLQFQICKDQGLWQGEGHSRWSFHCRHFGLKSGAEGNSLLCFMRQVYRAKPSTTRLPRKSPIKAFLSPNPLLVASFSFDIKQELFIASSYDTYTQAPKLRSLRDLTLQKLQNCLISRYSWYSRYSRPALVCPGLSRSVLINFKTFHFQVIVMFHYSIKLPLWPSLKNIIYMYHTVVERWA